jgi:signal transduction histidine kinase
MRTDADPAAPAQARPADAARTPRGISLKWRIAALTATLLVAFSVLLAGTVLIVQNASLQQYQRDVLRSDSEDIQRVITEGGLSEAKTRTPSRLLVVIYNTDGTEFSRPPGAPAVPTDLVRDLNGQESYRSLEADDGTPYLVFLAPVRVRLQTLTQQKVLAVAARTTYIRDAATAVGTAVAGITAALIVIALAGGYWAASFGLRPLVEVARQATRLNETNLHPLEYRGPRDELGLLTTTLNRLVERLRRAFDAQRVFLAETSHELRTPLTALEGYLHRAIREAPPTQQPALQDALRVSRTMTRLVADLLQLSRGEVVQEMVPHVVDLAALAKNVVREFPGVDCDCPPGRFEMIGDPDRLTQLTRNLVANAVRAAGRPTGVHVSVEARGARLLLHVRDEGPGIPPDILPNIFAKFYRGPQGGSGLGLAIVAQIARVHGGEIRVESRPGEGAHFWADLPALADDE